MKRYVIEIEDGEKLAVGDDLQVWLTETIRDGLMLDDGVAVVDVEPYDMGSDADHVYEALQHGDWFTADLLRLIQHADKTNRARLRLLYPEAVEAFERWLVGATSS